MKTPLARRERAALLLILLIGAWLRFQHLGAIEYNVDQAYPVWQAIRTLDEGVFPLVGQGTSVLFANPPMTGYLYLPVIALFRAPIAAYALTLVLNTFAIWLAYRALERLLGTRAALAGAALFAANPWIVEDSRRTWVQGLAPFFVCLIFWALAPVLTGQTRYPFRRTLIALVAFALFAHSYLLAYALAAPLAVLLILFRQRVPWRAVWIGGALFALLMALYAVGLARQWEDTQRRAEDFAGGGGSISTEALDHALRLVSGWNYAAVRGMRAPAGDAEIRDCLDDVAHVAWTAAIAAGALLAGAAIARRRDSVGAYRDTPLPDPSFSPTRAVGTIHELSPDAGADRGVSPTPNPSPIKREGLQNRFFSLPSLWGKGRGWGEETHPQPLPSPARPAIAAPRDAAIILLVWFALPVVMMSYVSRDVHPFYLLLTVPAGHGLAAWGVRPLLDRRAAAPLVAAVIATAALGGLNAVRFAQASAAHPGEDVPTLPLAEAMTLGERLRDVWQPGMAVYGDLDPWTPGTLISAPVRVERVIQHDQAMLIPPAGGLYIGFRQNADAPPTPPILGQRDGEPLALRDGTLIDVWQAALEDAHPARAADAPSDIGVRLIGWTLDGALEPGAQAVLTLFWRVESVAPDRGVWAFGPYAHVTDASGATIANAGGTVIPGVMWKRGDLMVHRVALDLPAEARGPLALDVGLYDSVRGVNAIFETPGADGSAQFGADVRLADP